MICDKLKVNNKGTDEEQCQWQGSGLLLTFKGYLRYKTIFCNKAALDV